MADENGKPPALDPGAEQEGLAMAGRAASLIVHADAARLAAYLEAGRLLLRAKEIVGHGHWLLFLDEHYAKHTRSFRRAMMLAEGVAYDAWLAGQIEAAPEQWTLRKALEYLGAGPALQKEMREARVVTDLAGARRVPIEEATAAQLRHHKRFATGQAPKPEPHLPSRDRQYWLPFGDAGDLLDRRTQELEEIQGRLKLAQEDLPGPEPLEFLLRAAEAHVNTAAGLRDEIKGALVQYRALHSHPA